MFRGPFGVLLTPFTEDGKVDYNAFESELDFLLKSDKGKHDQQLRSVPMSIAGPHWNDNCPKVYL